MNPQVWILLQRTGVCCEVCYHAARDGKGLPLGSRRRLPTASIVYEPVQKAESEFFAKEIVVGQVNYPFCAGNRNTMILSDTKYNSSIMYTRRGV